MWLKGISERMARTLAALFSATSLLLAAALVSTCWYTYRLLELNSPPRLALVANPPASPLQVRYQLDVPGRGEIFPALAAGSPSDSWPVAVLTIANMSERVLLETVSAEIPQWSNRLTTTVVVGPRETRAVRINPELLPQAYLNTEIRRAVLEVSASSSGDSSGYNQIRPVYLHSVSDLYWGAKFANAQFIARWVTPHDPAVIQLVASARGRLSGYDLPQGNSPNGVAAQVHSQAQAVFQAMRHLCGQYVHLRKLYVRG
jgi:hypothetical protein